MSSRAIVATAAWIAVAMAVTGCPGDPERVDTKVNTQAFDAASNVVKAVAQESWSEACSRLTSEARIEVGASVGRRQGRTTRPTCESALASETFGELCGELWTRGYSGLTVYREEDLDSTESKPAVAWVAAAPGGRITSRCEMRVTRGGSEDDDWSVDAIALKSSRAVLVRRRSRLVYRNATPVAAARAQGR